MSRIACCALVFCLAGCGGGGSQSVPVSGTVTLDGKPIADVRVSFQPLAAMLEKKGPNSKDSGVGSFATTDKDGRYVLQLSDSDKKGAVVGHHLVRFSDKLAESNEDAGTTKAPKARFPGRYSSDPLSFEVKPDGTDQANFDLNSK